MIGFRLIIAWGKSAFLAMENKRITIRYNEIIFVFLIVFSIYTIYDDRDCHL